MARRMQEIINEMNELRETDSYFDEVASAVKRMAELRKELRKAQINDLTVSDYVDRRAQGRIDGSFADDFPEEKDKFKFEPEKEQE